MLTAFQPPARATTCVRALRYPKNSCIEDRGCDCGLQMSDQLRSDRRHRALRCPNSDAQAAELQALWDDAGQAADRAHSHRQ